MNVKIPYGEGETVVSIPDRNVADILRLNEVKCGDERKLIIDALTRPLSAPALKKFISAHRKLLFIVNDATRPTPTARVLKHIYDYVGDELERIRPKFLVALGSHRAPTESEYEQIFGSLYEELKDYIFVHNAKSESELDFLGTTSRGTVIKLNKLVFEADGIITINSVEPHYFAGYTGGRKSFVPGVGGIDTITQNHSLAQDWRAQTLALKGNPIHEDLEEIAALVCKKVAVFSIQLVLDSKNNIYAVSAGDLKRSFYAAVRKANEVFVVKTNSKADIVVTIATYPMDIDLYQSQKALDNGKLALKRGGILILVSKCRTGIGNEEFLRLLASCSRPEDVLAKIKSEYKLGYHKAAKMAEIATWAEMWAVTDLPDNVIEKAFIKPYHDIQTAIDEALAKKGRNAKILVLLDGSTLVPVVAT